MNQLQQAKFWLNQGIATIPIGYRSKRPDRRHLKNGEWHEFKDRLPTEQELSRWFSSPLQNIGLVCGWQNLAIVDFDNLDAYDLWMQIYGQNGYADTYTVSTGRGWHLYFFIEDLPPHTMKWTGGEIKASGYCLIPPAIHPSGTPYKAVCLDMPIMTIGSIYDILPESVFGYQASGENLPCIGVDFDPFNPVSSTQNGSYSEINERVRILSFFPDARRTGDGWYTVTCPFHDDRNASGWIDDKRNRIGCHKCITGSLSIIDLYMRLNSCSKEAAVIELSVVG